MTTVLTYTTITCPTNLLDKMDANMFASDDNNPDTNSDVYKVLGNITSFDNYNNHYSENSSDYEEDYDYTNADTSLPLEELLPVSLVYGLTLLVGVVGNLLVIVAVARDRRLRSITNIFLTSLASADLALLCFCVPVKCVAFFSYTWAFGFFLCKSVNYFQSLAMVCSVMTLTMMSIERNIAIRCPLQSKRICTRSRAKLVVLLLWSGSVLLALPILVGQKHKPVGLTRKHYWCVREWDRPVYGILFESYMLILLFLLPVGVMIVSYTTICVELAKGTKFRRLATNTSSTTAYRSYSNSGGRLGSRRGQLSQEGSCREDMLQTRNWERMEKEKVKVIRMLIVVVVLFAVCWGPILFNNLLVSVGVLDNLHTGPLKPLRQTMFLMSYLNSSLNPLVYGFMSRHFRRGFREAICVCCSNNRRRGGEGMIRNGSRKSNTTCYYPSESHTSTEHTGTIRLSPVTEKSTDYCEVEEEEEEEDIDDTDDESSRHGRKVWARTKNVTLGLSGCNYVT